MGKQRPIIMIVSAVAGLGICAAAVFEDGRVDAADFRALGVMVVLISAAALAMYRKPKGTAAYEMGRADGHREGYHEGRRIGRPVLTRLIRCDCGRDVSTGNVARRGSQTDMSRDHRVTARGADAAPVDSPEWGTRWGGSDSLR